MDSGTIFKRRKLILSKCMFSFSTGLCLTGCFGLPNMQTPKTLEPEQEVSGLAFVGGGQAIIDKFNVRFPGRYPLYYQRYGISPGHDWGWRIGGLEASADTKYQLLESPFLVSGVLELALTSPEARARSKEFHIGSATGPYLGLGGTVLVGGESIYAGTKTVALISQGNGIVLLVGFPIGFKTGKLSGFFLEATPVVLPMKGQLFVIGYQF